MTVWIEKGPTNAGEEHKPEEIIERLREVEIDVIWWTAPTPA